MGTTFFGGGGDRGGQFHDPTFDRFYIFGSHVLIGLQVAHVVISATCGMCALLTSDYEVIYGATREQNRPSSTVSSLYRWTTSRQNKAIMNNLSKAHETRDSIGPAT